MNSVELDRIDLMLLALLQQNSHQTNAELAAKVHLSPSACLRRVQRLEKDGVIRTYRAEVDPQAIGLGLMSFVRVQLREHNTEAVESFITLVNQWPEVVRAYALTGDMDYLLQIAVRDLDHFSKFLLDRLLNNSSVADVNTSFVLRTVKTFKGFEAAK